MSTEGNTSGGHSQSSLRKKYNNGILLKTANGHIISKGAKKEARLTK